MRKEIAMRLTTPALLGAALTGLLYVAASNAAALPAAPRAEVAAPKPGVATDQVGYRRWGHRHYRRYGYYGPYAYYGDPYYYDSPYYGYGYPYRYRRPGFGLYLG